MSRIVPAIIPKSFTHLTDTFARVSSFADEVQIDVVDGRFVPFTSWPYGDGEHVSELSGLPPDVSIEVDLMLMQPETVLKDYVDAGVARVVVHLESTTNIDAILSHYEEYDYQLGFSIANDTALQVLTKYVSMIDFVQLMGIARIGSQGQPFDERVLARIRKLKELHPALKVSIDGSVNAETLPRLVEAGADRFVSGSAILKAEDPVMAFNILEEIAKRQS